MVTDTRGLESRRVVANLVGIGFLDLAPLPAQPDDDEGRDCGDRDDSYYVAGQRQVMSDGVPGRADRVSDARDHARVYRGADQAEHSEPDRAHAGEARPDRCKR